MRNVLVEREAELDVIATLAGRLADGRGGVLVIEGRSGIGKTSVLAALREATQAVGARVLSARCDELERGYAYGVMRQLLEPVVAERHGELAGAAALATASLGLGPAASAPFPGAAVGGDAGFAAMHALHELVAGLSADAPVVLTIDDAQWADRESARMISFLANRVEDQGVLIALTLRHGLRDGERRGPARLGARPETRVLELHPLSADGSATVLGTLLGAVPHPDFAAAVHVSVAGNPLLLEQLALHLRREDVDPTAAAAAVLADVDATSVARSVLVRLATLGDDERAVARAVAVLGDAVRVPAVAAVARVPPESVVQALVRLQRAEVLDPDGTAYAHAIVREAVLGDMTAAERGEAHGLAAQALLEVGVDHEQAGLHFLQAPGTGRQDVVAALRTAAAAAQARGSAAAGAPLPAPRPRGAGPPHGTPDGPRGGRAGGPARRGRPRRVAAP